MARKKSVRPFNTIRGYGWTNRSVEDLTIIMQRATVKVDLLREKLGFDAIAFCGSSGAAAAFILCMSLQIPLIYVRKKNERSHGGPIECNAHDKVTKYLIVDDFIDTGATVEHIIESIDRRAHLITTNKPVCVGAFLYQPSNNYKTHTMNNGVKIPLFH